MKNVWFILLLFSFAACKGQQDSNQKLTPSAFEKGISQQGIQLLDVRTAGEFKSGHIKNALQADWTNRQQFNERIQYVDKNKPVYVYCLVGSRSAVAADWMRQNGFTNVSELVGGVNSWKKENKPLEGMSNEPQMTMEIYWSMIPKNKTTLVDFGAPWCPPCVKMKPVLDELSTGPGGEKNKDLDFQLVKIDAGIHTNVMNALNIEPIPEFIIYKNGKEVWRKQGIVTREELLAQLK